MLPYCISRNSKGPTGVHTQTIESMNGLLKQVCKLRGGSWGRGDAERSQRVMAYAEIANSKLKVADTNSMQRVCEDLRMWCEDEVMGSGSENQS